MLIQVRCFRTVLRIPSYPEFRASLFGHKSCLTRMWTRLVRLVWKDALRNGFAVTFIHIKWECAFIMLFHVQSNIHVIFPSLFWSSLMYVFITLCYFFPALLFLPVLICYALFLSRISLAAFFPLSSPLLPFLSVLSFRSVSLLRFFLFPTFLRPLSFPVNEYILDARVRELWLH